MQCIIVTLKFHLHVTFCDDFLSPHMGKSYDISRENLLADRDDISRENLLADRMTFMIFDLRISLLFEPHHAKRVFGDFRRGKIQTNMRSYRS